MEPIIQPDRDEHDKKLWEPLSPTITKDELVEALVKAGVQIELFGTGAAKTIEHLMVEIAEGGSAFKPEGYVETQPDKINYYVWERVSSV